jgi:hypothetical protein
MCQHGLLIGFILFKVVKHRQDGCLSHYLAHYVALFAIFASTIGIDANIIQRKTLSGLQELALRWNLSSKNMVLIRRMFATTKALIDTNHNNKKFFF